MSAFLDYLLKLSVSFGLIALFYQFVLRKLTFYNANRHYLLLYSALCFIIPHININTVIEQAPATLPARTFIQSMPTITPAQAPAIVVPPPVVESPAGPTPTDWIAVLWISGMVVMVSRLCMHIRSYRRIKAQSWLVSDDGVRIYHFDLEISPFSFGNSIFYNPTLHQPDELQDMILHEYIHVRQWHSVDVIWSEILCIINWYNPFVWLIRSAIRQNLEYIADEKVLENHPDTKAYQYLLLKTAVGAEFSLVNQFGYHSLKQRIVMMNKNASPRIMLACFLFTLPLLAVMLAAFRVDQPKPAPVKRIFMRQWQSDKKTVSSRKPKDHIHMAGLLFDASTGKPLDREMLTVTHDDLTIKTIMTDEDGYYFAEVPVKMEKGVMHSYEVKYLSKGRERSIAGQTYQQDYVWGDGFNVTFLTTQGPPASLSNHYYIPTKPFYDKYEPRRVRSELKTYLLQNLRPFRDEVALKMDFQRTHRFPKDVITLYKGGYFDRKKELVGYEGETKLYLNGKEVTHREVNAAFKSYPYMLSWDQERRAPSMVGICTQIVYLTFPIHRDAPPAALVKGNVEVLDAPSFDPGRLQTEPYMLDGFRQVYGASSNLMPEKHEIKRIMLLKGRLARYYDPALDRIWWIETRPVAEVFERPDFARR